MTDTNGKDRTTRLVHEGRSATSFSGAVNPPVKRASTILTDDVSKLYSGSKSLYGRMGTEVHDTLIAGLKVLENAEHVQLAPNGLGACALALASVVKAGDHILVTDSAYGPTRRFCERYLARMGVLTTFFDPRISAAAFSDLIRENTCAAFFEMPGSLTFELHDLSSLIPICKDRRITTILDNTWSAGIMFRPLDIGIDISVQALTKYVIGHSDAFGGATFTNDRRIAENLSDTANDWGSSMSPDDAYLAQRGLRTLEHRIKAQGESALTLAEWLETREEVLAVHHPALTSHPDHQIFEKLFAGSSGLFSFSLKTTNADEVNSFFKAFQLFGFGFSWGGFESLIIPCNPQLKRSCSEQWLTNTYGTLIRIQVGLESTDDLRAELEHAFENIA